MLDLKFSLTELNATIAEAATQDTNFKTTNALDQDQHANATRSITLSLTIVMNVARTNSLETALTESKMEDVSQFPLSAISRIRSKDLDSNASIAHLANQDKLSKTTDV
jgi:hypothetical protein